MISLRSRTIIWISILGLLLAGCIRPIPASGDTAGFPTAQPAVVSSEATASSLTVTPTIPVEEVESTPAGATGATPQWSGTPDARFTQAEVVEVGFMDVGIFIVVLDLHAEVSGDFQGVIAGMDQPYPCTRLERYPERLYCSGPALEAGQTINFTLYPAQGGPAVFQTQVTAEVQ